MVFPVPEMEPALALQVTLVFAVPASEATKLCEPPAEMLVALGETVTETPPPVWPGATGFVVPLPQEAKSMIASAAAVYPNKIRVKPPFEW
jgi:hypothetical protein